jgi:hypothetical protein
MTVVVDNTKNPQAEKFLAEFILSPPKDSE